MLSEYDEYDDYDELKWWYGEYNFFLPSGFSFSTWMLSFFSISIYLLYIQTHLSEWESIARQEFTLLGAMVSTIQVVAKIEKKEFLFSAN